MPIIKFGSVRVLFIYIEYLKTETGVSAQKMYNR